MRLGGVLYSVFLLLILVACQTTTSSLFPESVPTQNILPGMATDERENATLTVPDNIVKNCNPETIRTIAPFKNIESGMSFIDACALIGTPAQDIGSGLHIFVYILEDGTEVYVGFASFDSPIAYVVHRYSDGTEEWLIESR